MGFVLRVLKGRFENGLKSCGILFEDSVRFAYICENSIRCISFLGARSYTSRYFPHLYFPLRFSPPCLFPAGLFIAKIFPSCFFPARFFHYFFLPSGILPVILFFKTRKSIKPNLTFPDQSNENLTYPLLSEPSLLT